MIKVDNECTSKSAVYNKFTNLKAPNTNNNNLAGNKLDKFKSI